VWTGEIPLEWEQGEIHPLFRTVGRPARAKFVVAANDTTMDQRQLHLMLLIVPSNFERSYTAATHLWVTLMAISDEGKSDEVRLEIAWDGQWDDGEAEMAQHLRILRAA
jgi:hypothetical protein